MSNSFQETLELIARLAQKHPDYEFELIQTYIQELHQSPNTEVWVQKLSQDLEQMLPHRADICQQIFEHALLKARQATYKPVNQLDAFLERYLYGIKDDQAVQKGSVSQAVKKLEEQQRKRVTPPSRAGRTNPLPPQTLPQHPGRPPENPI